ncbi:hypothetical protein M8845_18545 [Gelidibacter japonicus]|uniref:hypothetical protein n=1 Tax=Gelidibacter japonicus TaxID=1962232 RepID=UPI002020B2C0|nr:hypothetical protein [Gelidibacter japonicus]MCL8009431.1 hypothetical protein [Gelidibacter japonicus]
MKKLLLLVLLTIIISSCEQSKKYEYVELGLKESIFGGIDQDEKDAVIITAKTDSIAYLEAYQKFCISEKVAQDMQEALGSSSTKPTDFKLIDEQGNNVAQFINFDGIDSLKFDIRNRIFEMKNSLKETVDNNKEKDIENFKSTVQVDSAKIVELEKFFNSKKDEFDPNALVWHKPKSAPTYTNQNGIYCYFQTNNGMPSNLRLRMQYHADDWLFIQKVQFSIDDKAYEFIPRKTETDSGNGGRIWEWFDEGMGKSNTELLDALANAKSAKMKLIGRQYYKIKPITSNQIRDIKRSLDLYKAMGGTY